jgi:hypothetical protein
VEILRNPENKWIVIVYALFIVAVCVIYVSVTWCEDTTPPTGMVNIENKIWVVTTQTIRMTIKAQDESGVVGMCISNTDTCTDWKLYNKDVLWVLTPGNGIKTVHIWLRDLVGWESHTVETIRLEE